MGNTRCPKCGGEIPKGANYCSECGVEIDRNETMLGHSTPHSEGNNINKDAVSKQNKFALNSVRKKFLIIISVILLLLVCVFFYLTNKSTPTKNVKNFVEYVHELNTGAAMDYLSIDAGKIESILINVRYYSLNDTRYDPSTFAITSERIEGNSAIIETHTEYENRGVKEHTYTLSKIDGVWKITNIERIGY